MVSRSEMASNGVQEGSHHAVRSKADNFQSEHDKFLEDFEKPTVIYRLIRTTFLSNPRFLYRNLSYMKNTTSSRSTKRKVNVKFDLDGMLARLTKRLAEEEQVKTNLTKNMPNYLNVIVLGFWEGQNWAPNTEAKVDIQVVRIFRSRRKEGSVSLGKSFSATCRIPVKAQTEEYMTQNYSVPVPKVKYPALPIPKDAFSIVNGFIVESIKLVVRVIIPGSRLVPKLESTAKQDLVNGNENVDLDKCLSPYKGGGASNGRVGHGVSLRKTNGMEHSEDTTKSKRQRSLPTKDRENFVYEKSNKAKMIENVVYVGVLTIYDKDTDINIPDEGNSDLEIRLNKQQENKRTITQKRTRRENSWEISLQPDHSKAQDHFLRNGNTGNAAKISMAFRTSAEKMGSFVTTIDPVKPPLLATRDSDEEKDEAETVRVVYFFVRGSGPRQSTECRNDLRCPWCSVNCRVLYSLLKHLEICHPRFKFTFSRIANGARIDVAINESFDGSYTGSAYDLVAQPPGQAFGRDVPPEKRTQLFCMLAFKPKKRKREHCSIQEFFDNDDKNSDTRRSYMIGHNRLYHHTTTCLPIHAREIDVDSEGEPDPEWLRVKTCMMIDEFTDVNEGEKEIMKMWNHHVMHENYVGDCQIPLACKRFVERYGKHMIEKNLYRNFVLHLTNLYDFGLLPAQGFHATIQTLHCQLKENNSAGSLRNSWDSSSTLSSSVSSFSTPSSISTFNPNYSEPMDIDSCPDRNGKIITANGSDRNGL